ncbi:2'-deoxycytidine 5'-triphosphate deaminase [Aquisalinus flavus]|uniref:2'-deoxycytidine 5'-triphosphate deaminase n=1 Tax=Aquisalinus flavus TaxID=1526572 RepID=A0A8J2Y7B9_9PROT|nr:2'-deoxycytidine 5'-triphosphate deaminase [Aquisalinus flavus]GGD12670.1 2'-deoxycytidine 5'-triphosphate deaminase [Aquisalinus flavus]
MAGQDQGVFTAEAIDRAISDGAIRLAGRAGEKQIQPSSIDLTLGDRAYRIRASFLPGRGRTVGERLKGDLRMHELPLAEGAVLERGCVYLVPLRERLSLPEDVAAAANPKSSTGRIDVFVRLVTDGGTAFETVPAGYDGPLYAEISPRTFSIVVRTGSTLNQLRLKRGAAWLDDAALMQRHDKSPLAKVPGADGGAVISGGLNLTVQLSGRDGEIIGYRARRHAGLIDVDRPGTLDPAEFWSPITAHRSGSIILDPDEFYILASKEALSVPPDLAAEMVAIDPLLGEFRVHYAGFFDPGFGCTVPSRGVLEVRGHDAPFVLEDGQLVARLVYERLAGTPQRLYGADLGSNYQGQGLKLSKHFREWRG